MAESENQRSLRSLLCTEERDFFIRNNGEQVKIEELEGKIVGLYFSAHWCPPCRAFTPVLSEVYKKLVEKGDFEIIFVSDDEDEKSFEEYHKTMPWLALPLSDTQAKEKLDQEFDVTSIPTLILLDQKCKTISTDGVSIIGDYGAEAYPFSKERLIEVAAEKYPKEIEHDLHEHSLNLTEREDYACDGCQEEESDWPFYCKECDFDLHPDCALKDNHSDGNEKQQTQGKDFENGDKPAGVICEGDVCRRV